MFDIIGDVHGYAETLKFLLKKLGYIKNNNSYAHPERKMIFTGDLIDRGPEIRDTLYLVRNMVESGNAIVVMGNHEFNLLSFCTPTPNGGDFLRAHNFKNSSQHVATLREFSHNKADMQSYIRWMKQLPLFYETDNIRVVHAAWVKRHIDYVRKNLPDNKLTDEFLIKSNNKNNPEYFVVEHLLKGIEIDLPLKYKVRGADGKLRPTLRIKWWGDKNLCTYKDLAVLPNDTLPDEYVCTDIFDHIGIYPSDAPPVFNGHYWLMGEPTILRSNVCCLDYAVAKGGKLVSYRWDGEQTLSNDNFVFV